MKLTIAQALQQGVAAHKKGKLQDAERLYRAILQSQPLHPDANHNLGVLAVSVNKADAALPLFKIALEANPKIEQFWLSYIDSLIKEKQFDIAKAVLAQGKKEGLSGDKFDAVEMQLTPTAQVDEPKLAVQKKSLSFSEKRKKLAEQKKNKKAKKQNLKGIDPSQEQLTSLFEHYQNGLFSDAEKLAVSITQNFPKNQFAWKVLGAVLGATGRNSEALDSNQTAVALSPQDAQAHINLGIMLQELGRLDEAEASYAQAIALKPDYAEAHYNLGNTLKELGRLDEAEASYNQAIALKPDLAEAHSNLGNTLKELGRLNEAEASCTQAIALKPDLVEAHYNLGVTFQELGRLEEAEASYRQGIVFKPDFVEAHYNVGNMLKKLGRLDEAEASYNQAIALKPDYAEAHNNLGNTLKDLGKLDEAEASYTQAIALKSDYAQAHINLGIMLQEQGRLDEAEASYTQVIALKPDYAEAHYNLGNTLKELGRLEEAEASYNQAIALKPDYAEAHNNLGATLKELGRLEEAEASYSKAIALKPDYAEAHSNLGNTFKELGRLNEAESSCMQAIALKPDFVVARNNLGATLQELGRLDEALTSYNQAIELNSHSSEAHSNKYLCLNYISSGCPLFIFEQHLEFEKQFGGLQTEPLLNPESNLRTERRLRVGYVSGDFRKHSVAYFFEPLLQHHNPSVIETFCYYNNFSIDEMTKSLIAASDHWRSIVGINDSDVANLIRNDKIDILVDLSGHTSKNRLLVFARKPAPIQVAWLGYPNTTGLSAIDYRFTDVIADPIGKADELHSESLVRLANGFQCYKGNKAVHSNSELPFKRQGHVTFGSFNNLTKVTPEVIKVWSQILHAVPKSLLVLKANQLEHNANQYLNFFKQEGITEDRITLLGRMPSMHDHLELYNKIDICLDPFPFNGATTTCEALWMGVPVVALLGDRHVGRVGASILTNVGLTDFIAQDIDGYIQLAVDMASNTSYLKDVRKGLRERMLGAPLCDARSFASDVESAYQEMWHCYQE